MTKPMVITIRLWKDDPSEKAHELTHVLDEGDVHEVGGQYIAVEEGDFVLYQYTATVTRVVLGAADDRSTTLPQPDEREKVLSTFPAQCKCWSCR
jgi:hypothetical protein